MSSYVIVLSSLESLSLSYLIINCHLLCLPPLDEISPLPVQIPVVKPDPDRANPKIGVSSLAFSSDSRYLATKNGT